MSQCKGINCLHNRIDKWNDCFITQMFLPWLAVMFALVFRSIFGHGAVYHNLWHALQNTSVGGDVLLIGALSGLAMHLDLGYERALNDRSSDDPLLRRLRSYGLAIGAAYLLAYGGLKVMDLLSEMPALREVLSAATPHLRLYALCAGVFSVGFTFKSTRSVAERIRKIT